MLLIEPWDKALITTLASSRPSALPSAVLPPNSDGTVVRLRSPAPTESAAAAKLRQGAPRGHAEQAKVCLSGNIRRDTAAT
ncbi:MAG: hypothetical protein ACLTHL_07560 [Collinsella sp.]